MYPDIPPRLELRETISSPVNPAKVIGFIGRNKMLGQPAIVMKKASVFNGMISIPMGVSDKVEGHPELILLDGDTVLALGPVAYRDECQVHTFEIDGEMVTMNQINKNNESLESFPDSFVKINS